MHDDRPARVTKASGSDQVACVLTEPEFLFVEDDEIFGKAVERKLRLYARVRWLRRRSSALEAIASMKGAGARPIGAIIDVGLPDGNGLDVMATALDAWRDLPVAICSDIEARFIRDCAVHRGALPVDKPAKSGVLDAFAVRVCLAAGVPVPGPDVERARAPLHAWLEPVIVAYATRHSLTAAERAVVSLAMWTEKPAVIARLRGVTLNTTKTQISRILRKTGKRRLLEVRDDVKSLAQQLGLTDGD